MHMYGEVLVKHLFKKGDISELPICYLPPMNQIIIDNNINWDYEGITGSQGKSQTRVLTQHLIMFQRRKVQEAQTGGYYFNLFELYVSGGKKKPFQKKKTKNKKTQMHLYGEVLVKHLFKKRCYQRTPNLLFASHESDNH